MLTLTARIGEIITVGEMAVKVCDAKNGKVQLGFEGPKHIQVLRHAAKVRQPKPKIDVATAMNSGVPIHVIRDELDYQENQIGQEV
jgi:carbon storage regulator CsrA